jgi:plastocyanin
MRRLATTFLILASALAFAACGASGSGSGGSTPPDASAPAASDGGSAAACEVVTTAGDVSGTIAGNAFDPADVTATSGQVVAFSNEDSVPHTFTLDDGSCDTGQIANGASGAIKFSAAGSYPFHCTVHPSMKGTVTVS